MTGSLAIGLGLFMFAAAINVRAGIEHLTDQVKRIADILEAQGKEPRKP